MMQPLDCAKEQRVGNWVVLSDIFLLFYCPPLNLMDNSIQAITLARKNAEPSYPVFNSLRKVTIKNISYILNQRPINQ